MVVLQLSGRKPMLSVFSVVPRESLPAVLEPSSSPSESEDESSEEPLIDPYPIVETETSFYLMPQSSYERLTEKDAEGMTDQERMLARNEIYARHGRLFIAEDVKTYFEGQDWHEGSIQPEDFDDKKELNEAELRNIQFLLRMEKEAAEQIP